MRIGNEPYAPKRLVGIIHVKCYQCDDTAALRIVRLIEIFRCYESIAIDRIAILVHRLKKRYQVIEGKGVNGETFRQE